jgi:glycosyltransferase involved in cell wall biosynthesis
MKQKVLIIGPFGDIGGRELETGFIAETLLEDYEVKILSTGNLTANSQIFDFVPKDHVVTLNKKISKHSIWFKALGILSYLKSHKQKPINNYTSNTLAKKTGYRKFAIRQIKNEIDRCDFVLLCAQISSNYIEEIVAYANATEKKIILRTSATIKKHDVIGKDWLRTVDLFIHHSLSNANRLDSLKKHNFILIDQSTFKESDMLNIEPANQIKTLLYIGRLSPEKGIEELVRMFKKHKTSLDLKIIGDGELYNTLEDLSSNSEKIQLLGYLNQDNILKYIKASDAIIIPSHEESGPLVGLEAMASARLIISTKVGAMEDRLKDSANQFWFNINEEASYTQLIEKLQGMKSTAIEKTANQNRAIYIKNYKQKEIKSQYKNAIFNLIN